METVLRLSANSQDPAARGTVYLLRGHFLETWSDSQPDLRAEAGQAYQRAAEIYNSVSAQNVIMRNCEMEARAGLARTALVGGDLRGALRQVEEILAQAHASPLLLGAREPLAIYLSAVQVLSAVGDPRAPHVLETAGALLHDWSGKIRDDQVRRRFLEDVPTNRELSALWQHG